MSAVSVFYHVPPNRVAPHHGQDPERQVLLVHKVEPAVGIAQLVAEHLQRPARLGRGGLGLVVQSERAQNADHVRVEAGLDHLRRAGELAVPLRHYLARNLGSAPVLLEREEGRELLLAQRGPRRDFRGLVVVGVAIEVAKTPKAVLDCRYFVEGLLVVGELLFLGGEPLFNGGLRRSKRFIAQVFAEHLQRYNRITHAQSTELRWKEYESIGDASDPEPFLHLRFQILDNIARLNCVLAPIILPV
ncbi:hypothetical protein PG989_002246 [Apiospora arundinis]